ncbi:MAG: zinc ribbon domain-containing protein [Nitrospiraceae bacterium]|nr:MAG: zinc ribbon domain-containing protein [Nitrospiraceae bacterium]
MPVYEYKCMKCNQTFEIMQKITEHPLSVCAVCGGEMKKLITSTSFVLKGNGWYKSDYPSTDRKKAMDAEKPAEPSRETSPAPKTETKSETKKEAVNA